MFLDFLSEAVKKRRTSVLFGFMLLMRSVHTSNNQNYDMN